MASNIKGITIELNGDATGLSRAINSVNKSLRHTQSELKGVDTLLKFDPANVDLLRQKQELLSQSIEQTTAKLRQLRTVKQQADQTMQAGGKINEEEYRNLVREITATEKALGRAAAQAREFANQGFDVRGLDEAEQEVKIFTARIQQMERESQSSSQRISASFQKMGNSLKSVGSRIEGIGRSFSGVSAALVGGFTGAVVGTEELRRDLARLDTNAKNAGVSVEFMRDQLAYAEAVTGETDSSIEALSNLLAAGFDTTNMQMALEGLSGAATKFSDTLKLEGLADGLQETLATGAAVGPFAEMLERCGVSLDEFDAGLAAAKQNGTELEYALQTMVDNGLVEANEQWERDNQNLLENAEAMSNLRQAVADLGNTLTPIMTSIANAVTNVVNWFNNLSETGQRVIIAMGGVVAAIGPILIIGGKVADALGSIFEFAVKANVFSKLATVGTTVATVFGNLASVIALLGGVIKTAFSAIGGAVATPIGIAIVTISGLIAALTLLWNNCEGFRSFVTNAFQTISGAISTAFKAAGAVLSSFWSESLLPLITEIGSQLLPIVEQVFAQLGEAFQSLTPMLESIGASFGQIFGTIATAGLEILSALIPMFQAFADLVLPLVTTLVTTITEALAMIMPALLPMIEMLAATVVPLIQNIVTMITTAITTIMPLIITAIQAILPLIMTAISTIVPLITAAIQVITPLIQGVLTVISTVLAAVVPLIQTVINTIVPIITAVINTITAIIQTITPIIQGVVNFVIPLITAAVNVIIGVVQGIVGVVSSVVSTINGIIETISSVVSSVASAITGFFSSALATISGAFSAAASAITGVWNSVLSFFSNLVNQIVGFFTSLPGRMKSIGSSIVSGIIDGVTGAAGRLFSSLRNLATNALNAAKNALGINSPSKVFKEIIGEGIVEGIAKGIYDSSDATDAMKKESQEILSEAEKLLGIQKSLGEMSAEQELRFWKEIRKMAELQGDELLTVDKKIAEQEAAILEEQQKEQEEFLKSYEDRVNALTGFAGIFDDVQRESINGRDLRNNLQAQVNALEEYSKIMASLEGKGLSSALLEELYSQGIQALDELRAIDRMSEEELLEYDQLFGEKLRLAAEQAALELSGAGGAVLGTITDEISEQMKEAVGSAVGTLNETLGLANEPLQEMAGVVNAMNENAQVVVETQQDNQVTLLDTIATKVAEYVGAALLSGLAGIQDTILSAMPENLNLLLDGKQVASTLWSPLEGEGDRRNRIFAPSRQQIANIALSVGGKWGGNG